MTLFQLATEVFSGGRFTAHRPQCSFQAIGTARGHGLTITKFLVVLMLSISSLKGGITFDHTSTGVAVTGVGPTTQTWTHTVSAGVNRALFVIVNGLGTSGGSGGGSVTSVVFAGAPASFVAKCGGNWNCEVWEMVNPPVGAFSIKVTFPAMTSSFDAMTFSAISFLGTNQDSPSVLNSVDVTAGLSTVLSTSVTTTVAGTWLIGAAAANNGTLTAANGQTQIINNFTSGAVSASSGYLGPVAAGSNTFGWTRSGGTSSNGIVVVAVKPFIGNVIHAGVGSVASLMPPPPPGPRPYETSFYHVAGPSAGGDTQFCGWTSATTRPGNWNGGAIVCNYNDGAGFGCSGNDICLYELTAYNPVTPSATLSVVNTFTSYGSTSATSCYDAVPAPKQMKSRKPFALPGLLFQPILCLSSTPFNAYQSGLVVSPDGGAHWCNLKTFMAGGNTCTSSNWQAGGDNPVDAAGYQWPDATGVNKMTRMSIVDFLCQDNTINCPVANGVDPAYLYCIMVDSLTTHFYIARALKSLGIQIMLPANWTVWNAGSWDSTAQNATDVSGTLGNVASYCCSGWVFMKDFGVFGSWQQGGGSVGGAHLFATAPLPWGPWSRVPDIPTGQTNTPQFQGPLAGLCPKYVGGRITCTTWGNSSTGSDLLITEEDLGPIGPVWH